MQSPRPSAAATGLGWGVALARTTAALSLIWTCPDLMGGPRGVFPAGLSQSWRKKVPLQSNGGQLALNPLPKLQQQRGSYCLPKSRLLHRLGAEATLGGLVGAAAAVAGDADAGAIVSLPAGVVELNCKPKLVVGVLVEIWVGRVI